MVAPKSNALHPPSPPPPDFQDISLADFLGQCASDIENHRYVINGAARTVTGDFTFFKSLSTAVLGISTDSKYSHFAWFTQPHKTGSLGLSLHLPLLADHSITISCVYGVLIEKSIALHGLFLIDPRGVLRQMPVNDLPVGRSVEETVRLIKASQCTGLHGEVCPANWNEGQKMMKADPIGSLEYFAAQEDAVHVNGKQNGIWPCEWGKRCE